MTKNRETALRELRPEIPSIQEDQMSSTAEQFQNETLRPVLKLQNDLLLAVFKHYIQKRKGEFYKLKPAKRLAWIDHSVRKDLKFRNFLTGLVAGHFIQTEWEIFSANESELTRRIVDLMVQRLCDQVEKL
jgi:hypothetical protein